MSTAPHAASRSARTPRVPELLLESATSLARQIRRQTRSSVEVVEAHLAVALRENPRLNAIVESRFDQARREAVEADRRVASGETNLPPLLGVPCTIKEAIQVAGMHHTSGLLARSARRAEVDAVVVERIRAAGAIVIGTTNVSELCMWMESENPVYGHTSNPYDATRAVGGSSGGEGAAVGAGFVPFGIGADVGGSIRIPAFMNGVFGHKPTGGLIPNRGQYPEVSARILTTGPLCRRAEDLPLLVSLLAGPDPRSPETFAMPLGDARSVSLEGLAVMDLRSNGISSVAKPLLLAQASLASHLARQGARVSDRPFAGLWKGLAFWATRLASAGSPDYAVLLGDGQRISRSRELVRMLLGRSSFTAPSMALALAEGLAKLDRRSPEHVLAELEVLRDELESRIGDGVLLFPSYPVSAPRHRASWGRPLSWAYTAIFNALELPSTQVPLGLDREGLPLGCQVIARRGQDHRSIAIALEVERALGGWVPPRHLST